MVLLSFHSLIHDHERAAPAVASEGQAGHIAWLNKGQAAVTQLKPMVL